MEQLGQRRRAPRNTAELPRPSELQQNAYADPRRNPPRPRERYSQNTAPVNPVPQYSQNQNSQNRAGGGQQGIDFSQSTDAMILDVIRRVREAKKLPFTEQQVVDGQELVDALERARRYLPKEIKNAHWLIEHNQELLANTRQEAENMLRSTQQQMAQMIDEHEITQQAKEEANRLMEEAGRKSREIHRQALEYAASMLNELEEQLTEMLVFIQKNKKQLEG